MVKRLNLLVVAVLSVVSAERATAQQHPAADTSAGGRASVSRGYTSSLAPRSIRPPSFSIWAGTAQNSAFKTRIGTPLHRDVYIIGVRASWPVATDAGSALQYFVDIFPAVMTTNMPDYSTLDGCLPGWFCPQAHPIPHTVYGAGLSPLGFSVRLLQVGRVRLSAEASGGFLYFTRPVPDPDATRFNFTASGGATLEVRLAPNHSARVMYLYHHTSNGGRGLVNPGLNSQVIALGMDWWR
jgi:hypothetical protein